VSVKPFRAEAVPSIWLGGRQVRPFQEPARIKKASRRGESVYNAAYANSKMEIPVCTPDYLTCRRFYAISRLHIFTSEFDI
jgi:hypothetical protein